MNTNPEIELARRVVEETDCHLFLTGRAGTGKTTFLRSLVQESRKRMVVLAPTGIAAVNAGGATIHSFFQITPGAPYIPDANYKEYAFNKRKIKLIRSLDLLVIDEISMVRADLLDNVDALLRRYRDARRPFGGVQLLMIGDLQQLAPVVTDKEQAWLQHYYDTPYFFSSRALRQTEYVTIELQEVFRQRDAAFIDLLGRVRAGSADASVLAALNSRCLPGFEPPREEGYIRLVTHNRQAQAINDGELARLPDEAYTYVAETQGNFPEASYPTDERLVLKRGAQVMFVKNDPEHRYVNGTIGEVVYIDSEGFTVRPLDTAGEATAGEIDVKPVEWTNTKYVLNERTKEIEEQVEGQFRQFPVKTAWAITVHKSQGLTFARAIVDVAAAFAHGQTYVALSRCKSLEGLVLNAPIPASAIISDNSVAHYTQGARRLQPGDRRLGEMQRRYFLSLLTDLFDFGTVAHVLQTYNRAAWEHFSRQYSQTVSQLDLQVKAFGKDVEEVGQRFGRQLSQIVSSAENYAESPLVAERLDKSAVYFLEKLLPLQQWIAGNAFPTDNKVVKKRMAELQTDSAELLRQKCELINHIRLNGYAVADFQRVRSLVVIGEKLKEKRKDDTLNRRTARLKADTGEKQRGTMKPVVPSDILYPELFEQLTAWRTRQAAREEKPAYMVLWQKTLVGIVNLLPLTPEELRVVPYFGSAAMKKYGEDILHIVHSYVDGRGIERPEPVMEFVPAAKKGEREDTKSHSLRLYREGRTVEDIARERGLAYGTIYHHLATAVLAGALPLRELVPDDHLARIVSLLHRQADPRAASPGELSAQLGEDIPIREIRLVSEYVQQQTQ